MKIDFNTVAEVAYKILLDHANGEMIEYADEDNPRRIVLGQDDLIPGFEEGLKGKTTGPFSFSVRQDKAFGSYDSTLVTDVPKQAFLDDGVIREDLLFTGNRVNMLDHHHNKVTGTILEIGEEKVRMDFNHPLAGKDLFVTGEVLSVREATADELTPDEGCGCGSGCGCQSHETRETEEEAYCETCGNPADKMGQGYGNCQCG